ncbi:MAG: GPW/gp25 family protein [Paenirhodobacter sp.]|uniref:GPW/gp25 family protein n=1 Tax=Paenirhodobacter sp. TaxID=1965326 RepID=UPI003D0B75BA
MSWAGMSKSDGSALDGIGHLRQSVIDILTTPIGSRVMKRDYGSQLFDLIDQNLTQLTIAQIYAATVEALRDWEPRLRVTKVLATATNEDLEGGQISLTIYGEYLPDGQEIMLDGIVL